MNLRLFSKILVVLTLFLIFAGGMVKSTESGLSVPDWPLSYGMLFPPMVGGVFYEHGHRMIATLVGFAMLIMTIWIAIKEKRSWLKNLSYFALAAVIAQGVLGGLTVLYYLPAPISVAHGMLAQTFLLLTIFIAYSLSNERDTDKFSRQVHPEFLKGIITLLLLVYIQLMAGAVMRHTESGLAIYDFPTMGGEWFPRFDDAMLQNINDWRFMHDFEPVNMLQVVYHFVHRAIAIVILIAVIVLNLTARKYYPPSSKVWHTVLLLDLLVALQIGLGIFTVLTLKSAIVTSVHVVNGAGLLGLTFFLLLRASPSEWKEFTKRIA